MSGPAITIENVRKSFGSQTVIGGVDIRIEQGSLYGLVGLNGAGKTTLIRLLLGLLRPDSGMIRVSGRDPWKHEPDYCRDVGVVLEHDGFFPNLTFRQNISFFARAKGISDAGLSEYLAEFRDSAPAVDSDRKAKHFSRGQRAQCAICRAFLGWPAVCFLDEPVVALDIEAYEHFCSLLRRARERGCTMVISSHVLEPIEAFCDRVGLLENGRIRDIRREDGDAGEPWMIRTDGGEPAAGALADAGAREPRFVDGAWRFSVLPGAGAIPALVKALVDRGCRVAEVRPDKPNLREAIRGKTP